MEDSLESDFKGINATVPRSVYADILFAFSCFFLKAQRTSIG